MNLLSNLDCACLIQYDDAIFRWKIPDAIFGQPFQIIPPNQKKQSMIKFTQLNSKVTN